MKKNILIIVLAVISLLLAGIVGYFIAEKVVSNKYENGSNSNDKENNKDNVVGEKDEVKELSLTDNLVTDLIYPKDTTNSISFKKHWQYKNTTIDTLGREKMMYNAVFGLTPVSNTTGEKHYSAKEIKNNFIKIFGPDINYYDGDLKGVESCNISKYDAEKDVYIAYTGCGGASLGYVDRVSKKYKAENIDEYIYIYEYVQSVWIGPKNTNDWQSPTIIYLLDRDMSLADETSSTNKTDNNKILNSATETNYESLIYQMMDKGEIGTYKWTFKKQSDGKYYFYSGAWEN